MIGLAPRPRRGSSPARRPAVVAPRAVFIDDVAELTSIYLPEVALVCWPRPRVVSDVELAQLAPFNWVREVRADGTGLESLADTLSAGPMDELKRLVEVHSALFEVEQVGVRVALTDAPLCPGFHVDRVPCRLVWVLAGAGTEWVEGGLPVSPDREVQQLPTGAAAWFKGSTWPGGSTLVHRSAHGRRLVATVDLL